MQRNAKDCKKTLRNEGGYTGIQQENCEHNGITRNATKNVKAIWVAPASARVLMNTMVCEFTKRFQGIQRDSKEYKGIQRDSTEYKEIQKEH